MATFLLLPGLSGDIRIFDHLVPRLVSCVVVPWIAPHRGEPITSYAERLSLSMPQTDEEVVVGVSFGGIIAQELAIQRRAQGCVIISSVRDHDDLPMPLRRLRWVTPLVTEWTLSAIGATASVSPFRRGNWIRIGHSLSGEKGDWRRWAIPALLRWRANPKLDSIPLLQIHGDHDETIPISKRPPDLVIQGGGHLIAFTHAEEIARGIRRFTDSL